MAEIKEDPEPVNDAVAEASVPQKTETMGLAAEAEEVQEKKTAEAKVESEAKE